MIKENRRVPRRATANRTAVSRERVQVVTADLGYRELRSRWVSRTLTEELKQKRMSICLQLLLRYEGEGDEFLCHTVQETKAV
jgi:hypothetical protein